MTGAQLLIHQVRYEQKSFWRNPVAAVFIVAFPLMFLFIFASLSGRVDAYGGISEAQYVVPQMLAYGLMNACFTNPAINLTYRRETGLLKRLRLTPLPRWAALGGIVGNALLTAILIGGVILIIGFAAYGIHWYGHVLALLVAVAVGVLAFTALGAAVSTFIPNEDAAPPVVNFAYIGLLFLSGNFIPISPGSTLARIGDVFPVRHLDTAIITTFLPGGPHGVAQGFAWSDVGVLAIWGAVGVAIAVRRWRWEPRRSG